MFVIQIVEQVDELTILFHLVAVKRKSTVLRSNLKDVVCISKNFIRKINHLNLRISVYQNAMEKRITQLKLKKIHVNSGFYTFFTNVEMDAEIVVIVISNDVDEIDRAAIYFVSNKVKNTRSEDIKIKEEKLIIALKVMVLVTQIVHTQVKQTGLKIIVNFLALVSVVEDKLVVIATKTKEMIIIVIQDL